MTQIRNVLITGVILCCGACGNKKEEAATPSLALSDVPEIVCTYAPSQSKVVTAIAGSAGGAAATALTVAQAAGLTAVLHSSGAYIFTGSGGYVAGTLGGALTGPAIVTVGVVAGGAAATIEILCAPRNHPEFVAKVEAAADEFYARAKTIAVDSSERVSPIAAELQQTVVKSGIEAFEYANRKSVELSEALRK